MALCYEPVLGSLLKGMRHDVWEGVRYFAAQHTKGAEPFTLLDCCCGAGGFLQISAQQEHMSTVLCTGLDSSSHMLHAAQKRVPQGNFVQGDALALPFANKSIHMATICMALHTMQSESQNAVINELLRVSQRLIVVDYCLTERNIHFPVTWLAHAIEWCVGGEHYACYKAFMRGGALEGLFYTMGLVPAQRRLTLGGAGLIFVVEAT